MLLYIIPLESFVNRFRLSLACPSHEILFFEPRSSISSPFFLSIKPNVF